MECHESCQGFVAIAQTFFLDHKDFQHNFLMFNQPTKNRCFFGLKLTPYCFMTGSKSNGVFNNWIV